MLITTQKPLAEVHRMLASYKSIGIIGCSDCCAVCQTGGSEQIKEMAQKLNHKQVVFSLSCESPCDQRVARRDLRRVARQLEDAEALLLLTCGIGLQSLGQVTDKILIPGTDTHFAGSAQRIGQFYEFCSTCGDCILGETAGICPVARCAKGLLNGPCEDMTDGKCEAWDFERDCAWYQIYQRLQARGQLTNLNRIWAAPDRRRGRRPRELVWQR